MGHWKDKYVIGITGNIATGKSLVRKMLQHLGAYTVDADGLAHQVMAPNAPAYRPIIEWFGKWVVGQDGRIDRERLGSVAFSHPLALKRLEDITHPIIGQAIDTLIARAKHKIVVVEAIKLLEGDLAGKVDAIWVVDSTPEKQLERLMQSRGMTQLEARKRITVQNPQSEKLDAAKVVIQNNGDPSETFEQVKSAWDRITGATPASQTTDTIRMVVVNPQAGTTATRKRELKEIKIKRPKPSDFDAIARLINTTKGKNLSKADIMISYSETSYLVAESANDIVGLIGFVVENLITQSSEIAIPHDVPIEPVLSELIKEMEEAADALQSEVSFIYLHAKDSQEVIGFLTSKLGYNQLERVEDIKFPAWREALRSRPEGTSILVKQLREDRILTPF